jgi:hypothetical protein
MIVSHEFKRWNFSSRPVQNYLKLTNVSFGFRWSRAIASLGLRCLNEKVCVWICVTLQSQITRSALTISFWVIYVWLCKDSTDFFSDNLSGRAIYVWLQRFWFSLQRIIQLSDRFALQSKGQIFSLGLKYFKTKHSRFWWVMSNALQSNSLHRIVQLSDRFALQSKVKYFH